MPSESLIREHLFIPRHHQRILSSERVVCLVHDEWLLNIRQRTIRESPRARAVSKADAALLLAPSHQTLPKNWSRVCIKVVHKGSQLVNKLHNGPLYNAHPVESSMEHLVQSARENFRNLWSAAHVQYSKEDMERCHVAQDQLTNVLRAYFQRLKPNIYIKLSDTQDSPEQTHSFSHHDNTGNNIVPTLAVIEASSVFFLVQPFVSSSLHDVVAYSPAIFSTSHAKSLFVLYQILHAMMAAHQLGLTCGELTLHNVRIDKKLWVNVTYPHTSFITKMKQSIVGSGTESRTDVASGNDNGSPGDTHVNRNSCSSRHSSSEHSDNKDKSTVKTHSNLNSRLSECEHYVEDGKGALERLRQASFKMENLAKVTEDWVHHRISNFQYLLMLNHLAGRVIGDPNHHPVMPWVIDFTSSRGGFRDLKMSKYRLNKGDNQLDFTYETMSNMGINSEHIPHHISDVLSDITYYVYKARKTPKHILCTYVRSKWVPNEYPVSIERMYEWTPDECIPEFYTDPTIFSSIHDDLPDLELPSWCSSAAEFVDRHMAVLESEQVSSSLHHWIDLTFGYKLSGTSAVRAKNVCLHLADQHKHVVNHGVVQLFNQPHPLRTSSENSLSMLPPRIKRKDTLTSNGGIDGDAAKLDSSMIKLPADYNPVAALDHFEALHSFTSRTCETLPPSTTVRKENSLLYSDIHENVRLVWGDMQQFGCLMCELYLAPKLHIQAPGTSLTQRYELIGQLCARDYSNLPRMIQTAAEVLLHLGHSSGDAGQLLQDQCGGDNLLFEYPLVNSLGLQPPSPNLLLQPFSNVLSFPPYFASIYDVLNRIKTIDNEIEKERFDLSKSKQERKKIEKVLSRKKVDTLEKYFRNNKGDLTMEGYEIILPYIKELFEDANTTVQAAWSLLGLVGKDLGATELKNTLLQSLTKLFNGSETTPKHMKLYHRSFLVQLLLQLGLSTFVNNFCTLLVEAVAGYKDFVVDIEETSQDDLEADLEDDVFVSNRGEGLDDTTDSMDTDLDQMEDVEDVRPDQTDDAVDEERDDVMMDDILDDDGGSPALPQSRSMDSFGTDQASQRSTGSDSMVEEETLLADKASSDRVSIHSISHIIEMSQEQPIGKQNHSVHFELNQSELSANGQSKQASFETDQPKHFSGDNIQSKESQSDKDYVEDADADTSLSRDSNDGTEQSKDGGKSGSFMIRSETDEFRQIHYSHTINICHIAAESIKWLCHRLGPLLTAKYLSKNLVRMLALCYFGEDQLVVLPETAEKTTRLVQGDKNAEKVLECLSYVAAVYGEQVILLQYIPCIIDLIHVAKKRLTVRAEAGLVAAVVLLRQIIPLLSDKTFLEILQDSIVRDALHPVVKVVSSRTTSFPSGPVVRSLILYKTVDVLYILGLRLGFELTRRYLTITLKAFFKPFEQVYVSDNSGDLTNTGGSTDMLDTGSLTATPKESSMDDSFLNIKMDDQTHQYMIGSPVTINQHMSPVSRTMSPVNRTMSPPESSTSSRPLSPTTESMRKNRPLKSNYSLSDSNLLDEKDEVGDSLTATEEILQNELCQTFTSELALAAYIPLTSVYGSHHMEENLPSDDMIRKMCSQYDKSLYTDNEDSNQAVTVVSQPDTEAQGFGSNVAIVGNRICLQEEDRGASPQTTQLTKHLKHKGILRIDPDETKSGELERWKQRHLKGNWLAYWEHELGLNERDTLFNFKHIKLQTFQGHANSIRSLTCLDNENSFISASKDKTVKLWSLSSFGDGQGRCKYQWSYDHHKKSVFSVAYLENMRLVTSCDSTVHIWDPFTGDTVRQLESTRYSPVIALAPLPGPSTSVMMATTDGTLRFLDVRTASYAHEYKCVVGSAGMIRCITASPDASWVAVGFSSGVISLLDLNTGVLLGSWKGHEGEILQLKAFNKTSFVSTSFDLAMKLWNVDGREICSFKGHTEPIHCVHFYRNQLITGTTNNRIGVHTSVDGHANFSVTKLQSDVFKGVLTSMAILPLNRTLLLGADNGIIRLLC